MLDDFESDESLILSKTHKSLNKNVTQSIVGISKSMSERGDMTFVN